MTSPNNERELAVKFLLGYLPEEERDALADRLFSDDPFFDLVEEAERDLLDAYVRGELNAKDRAAVDSRLLTSERQLEKLQVAKVLAARTPARTKARVIPKFLPWAAAVIVMFGGGGAWLLKYGPSRKAPPPSTSQRVVPKAPAPVPPMVVALLSPGANREAEIQHVVLPQRVEVVRLDLQLPGDKAAASYAVRLMRQREPIYQAPALLPHRDAGMQLLSVTVSATLLPAGQYRLYATPVDSPAERTTYNFQVR